MSKNHKMTEITENLIHEHFDLEPDLEKVIWINPERAPEIRLLEINAETIATGVVQSFYFPPSDEIPYALLIAEITPEEWQRVLRKEIPLPDEWTLDNFKDYSREPVSV